LSGSKYAREDKMKMNRDILKTLSGEKNELLNAWAQTERGFVAPKNIYAIDDSWSSLSLIKNYLKEMRELKTHTFDNEFEALRAITTLSPDLLILDINLLNINGIKLSAMIANIYPVKIPTVFISGDASAEKKLKNQLGDIVFVPKPFRKDSLLKAIEQAMDIDLIFKIAS
jgi:two-component SAPR family response regulator